MQHDANSVNICYMKNMKSEPNDSTRKFQHYTLHIQNIENAKKHVKFV